MWSSAPGPLGLAVMRELRRRGKLVRMINRSSRVRFEKDLQTEVGGYGRRLTGIEVVYSPDTKTSKEKGPHWGPFSLRVT